MIFFSVYLKTFIESILTPLDKMRLDVTHFGLVASEHFPGQ
jgi:hypothetical protein